MTIQYTTSPLPTRTAHYTKSSFPQGQILVLFHCLHSMHSLASVSSLPACFSAHTLSGKRFSLLPRSFPLVGRLALFLSPAAGLFPPRRQDSFLPGGRTLSSPAAGLFPPRRQDSFLPGGRTLSSPAAGLFPPRRQDSFLPGGRTLSSPAAGLFPPRRQDSFLPCGRTLTSPPAGLSPPLRKDCHLAHSQPYSGSGPLLTTLRLWHSLSAPAPALTLALAVPFSWRPRPFSAATSFRWLILVAKAWSGCRW